MAWYRSGTASFTNGSATVTGSGTAFIANASIGEGLIAPDGRTYEITNIVSDTSLTISPAYLGSTASGQGYAIAPLRGRIADLIAETSSLLASFSTVRDGIGAGLFPDGSAEVPGFRFSNDQDTGVYRVGSNILGFSTGGNGRAFINASGNFGIGTSSPISRLDVVGSTDTYARINDGAVNLILQAYGTGSSALLGTTSNHALTLWANAAERMRITPTGNVGIGTASPGDKLTVAGAMSVFEAGVTDRLLLIPGAADSGSTVLSVNSANNQFRPLTLDASTIVLSTGGAGRQWITGAGNVGIGTNTPRGNLDIGTAAGTETTVAMHIGYSSLDFYGFRIANTNTAIANAAGLFRIQRGTLSSWADALVVDNSGNVRPGADNGQSLGDGSFRWSVVYAGTGTINTSDEREKHWRGELNAAELRAAKRIIGELGIYQWNDAVAEKGEDGARLHFGVRAQRAFAIMEDEGLDWGRYAWCCYNQWDEQTEPVMAEVAVPKTRKVTQPSSLIDPAMGQPAMVEVDEAYEETEMQPTGEARVTLEAGDRYGVRPDQLAFWLIAAQAAIQADLEARLAALEAA